MPGRRQFLKSSAGLVAATFLPAKMCAAQSSDESERHAAGLPPWEPGVLELHHIDTGRGNSTLVLGPDGTSMLIDAGEAHSAERTMAPARPDGSRPAGEWIARYVQRQLERITQSSLDVMLLTHLHGDHVGEVAASSAASKRGNYRLTGAACVADAIAVGTLVDRGWPDYRYPLRPTDATALNYIALATSMAERGTQVQRARAGALDQLSLRKNRARFPGFSARVVAVNGEVWTDVGETSKALFPALAGLPAAAQPTENMCCVAVRMQYGGFSYYSGGDLTCDTDYGRYPWHDIETPVAKSAGPVSVAVANHHGYFDACGPAAVRALKPRAWVLPSWHASHPAMNVLANLFSEELYTGDRQVFATGMTPEALLTTERFSSKFASSDGHVIVRVPAGGKKFTVYIVNAHDEAGTVVKSFGPYAA